ncbi:MAG: hypothetical protein B7Y36_07165 [Novosphingobium sp. 28-62-57]|uniref:hypothetical protein n=1 Tax=unclassified Novosphingobium TaxID=2644732 RepID=UPI000BCC186F|nr:MULTISPECIES: hypothetical protein [unclassified Novosphingobium]OYW51045.1 MAG: hypothetical protein B7Z34_01855 [Novosphingobium sp. 12-62-10]OYZ11135.1 MAG: hypothetical protein B7Y36_07165 [Novosphingobium sp. 28-62-57]OYZ22898.1 MAG: hypothetical protein B7Y31_14585 [Novosphingobium sp. 16-62-11]HQS70448.1 hypothetical protein [Novosphingobium sp.]
MRLNGMIILALHLGLAACGSPKVEQDGAPLDPVMAEALQGQLMVDPDLTQQNMRNLAIKPGGPVDPALPLPDANPAG